jgi:hypothetical protein
MKRLLQSQSHRQIAGFVIVAIVVASIVTWDALRTSGNNVGSGAGCVTEPRPVDAASDPLAIPPSDPLYVPPKSMPRGTGVDPETRVEIENRVRQLVACVNSDEPLRLLNLYSDELLRRLYPADERESTGSTFDLFRAYASPVDSAREAFVRLHAIGEAVALSDGRIAVIVQTRRGDSGNERLETTIVIFARGDDGWIVDELGDADESRDDSETGQTD